MDGGNAGAEVPCACGQTASVNINVTAAATPTPAPASVAEATPQLPFPTYETRLARLAGVWRHSQRGCLW